MSDVVLLWMFLVVGWGQGSRWWWEEKGDDCGERKRRKDQEKEKEKGLWGLKFEWNRKYYLRHVNYKYYLQYMKVKVYYIPNYFVNYITLQFFTVLKYFEIKTIHPWEEEQIVIGPKKTKSSKQKSLAWPTDGAKCSW